MNKRNITILSMLVISFALLFTSCPSPSSGGGSDDEDSQGYIVDFGHSEGASIEVTVDFSGMAEKDRVGFAVAEIYESPDSSRSSLTDSGYSLIRSVNGDNLIFSIIGARVGYWYSGGITLYDIVGLEILELSYSFFDTVQASSGVAVSTTVYAYDTYDGRYTGANPANLTGTIDISSLDKSLLDCIYVNLYAEDLDDTNYDPDLYYRAPLDDSDSVSYQFTNLDPDSSYSWYIQAHLDDWNGSTLAYDEYYINGGANSVSINSGPNTKDFTALHTFDTNDSYDGGNGEAIITGTLDISNLASDTYCIYIDCVVSDSTYRLDYEFMNFESSETLTYRFTNLDPTMEHTLTFDISTEGSDEYTWDSRPEEVVSADDLNNGQTTVVDFTMPTP